MSNPNIDIRKIRGTLTQEEFAKELGITRELLGQMERGDKKISKATKILIENYLSKENKVPNDLILMIQDLVERMIRQESTTSVLKETVANLISQGGGKQAALASAELDEAIAMVSTRRMAELKIKG